MFKIINWRVCAERYHRSLPEEIRSYLKGRGIPSTLIEQKLLGWDGQRITIPILGTKPGEVLGVRYATVPKDLGDPSAAFSHESAKPELYGWETLAKNPRRVVICENAFDRLVLEANSIEAVASTGGPNCFLAEWARLFARVRHVYVCFSRGSASNVRAVLPSARISTLPAGATGITDFFARLGRTKVDFEIVLATAATPENDEDDEPPVPIREFRPGEASLRRRAEQVKRAVRLHEITSQFAPLEAEGGRLVAHCPFHDDRTRSFTVYPKTDTYYCFGCGASGGVIKFLADKESMTFRQALEALERFELTGEIYGAA
jgi:DNA primase